jgi:hypothetical protein
LLNRSPQHLDPGNHRAPSTGARQAAEALFAPKSKPQRVEPPDREAVPAGERVRTPRVLTITAMVPAPHDEAAVREGAQPPSEHVIPSAHLARIRAWLKYGMTAAQVAEMYGIAAGEVENILRTA